VIDTQKWLVDFHPDIYIESGSKTNIDHFTLQLGHCATSTGKVLAHAGDPADLLFQGVKWN